MKRLGVVVNPTAGSGDGVRDGAHAIALLREHGHKVTELTSESAILASKRARQAIVDGIDALIVVGGDGMAHLGVNLVAETSLPLGIIAVGTGNDAARTLGLPIHDVEASIRGIDAALRDGGVSIDAVTVGDPNHAVREWYIGVLSAGFDAAVNERANQLTWPRGSLRYLRALARELRTLQPYDYKVTLDGKRVWESPGTVVAVANTRYIGGGLRMAPAADFCDGLLDVVLIAGVSKTELVRVFPRLYNGTHGSHPAVRFERARSVLIEPGRGNGNPIIPPPAAYADGERIGPTPLLCEVQGGALTILMPKA